MIECNCYWWELIDLRKGGSPERLWRTFLSCSEEWALIWAMYKATHLRNGISASLSAVLEVSITRRARMCCWQLIHQIELFSNFSSALVLVDPMIKDTQIDIQPQDLSYRFICRATVRLSATNQLGYYYRGIECPFKKIGQTYKRRPRNWMMTRTVFVACKREFSR